MKATLTFLFTLVISSTVFAGTKCPLYFQGSTFSQYSRQVESVLESKGYEIVKDVSSAIGILKGYSISCDHGSSEVGCESATATVVIVDRYTGHFFYYQGTDEGSFFGANYKKALARALNEIPRCSN